MTVPVSKRILLNALETEFPAFHQTKNPDKVFHLDWPDATVFLYFLHSILSFDKKRQIELTNEGKGAEFVDMYGLILIMRQVGFGLYQHPKFGFVLKPMYKTPNSTWGWNKNNVEWNEYRGYLMQYAQFVSKTLKGLGKLFGTIK